MQYKIYLITNTVNGKKYVGQTKGKVSRRWTNHKVEVMRRMGTLKEIERAVDEAMQPQNLKVEYI